MHRCTDAQMHRCTDSNKLGALEEFNSLFFWYERKSSFNNSTMSTLSPPNHKLFINFRGKDIRYGFASHLTDALKRHNIKFFIDSHEQMGRDKKHLFKRIEQATISLVILSPRYGESKYCLEELRTIMEKVKKGEMIVIPIFYKVKPEDVKRQKEEFGYYSWKRFGESSIRDIKKWQTALKAVTDKLGLTLDHKRSEAKFIKKVIKEIRKVLEAIPSDEGREEEDCVKTSPQ